MEHRTLNLNLVEVTVPLAVTFRETDFLITAANVVDKDPIVSFRLSERARWRRTLGIFSSSDVKESLDVFDFLRLSTGNGGRGRREGEN